MGRNKNNERELSYDEQLASIPEWDHRGRIELEIKERGGYVNAHAHPGRANTTTASNLGASDLPLSAKWGYVDQLKAESTVDDYIARMDMFVLSMIAQGAFTLGCFIDVDGVVQAKEMEAISTIKARYKGEVEIVTVNQTLKGVIDPEARFWFNEGAKFVDIIGGLPAKDGERADEALDILFGTASDLGLPLHVHVDQNNTAGEDETWQLIEKTKEFGMQGRVVAIHGISVAAHNIDYRNAVYDGMAETEMGVIANPWAWIDARRTEELQPSHNSITPVEELIRKRIIVGLGTDNIRDVYLPLNIGDMWDELHLLAAACHFYDIEQLVNIATDNGRKLLFLPPLENQGRVENGVARV